VAETEASPAALGGYRALLSNRAYRTVLGSEVLVHVGGSLYVTVLPWLVLEITGSRSAAGWATTAVYLPYLLVSVPAGTLVDRADRRRLMMAAYLLRALLAAAIPVLYSAGALAGWHVLSNAALVSSLGLLSYLVRCSVLPQIVSRDRLITANSANSLFIGLAMMIGTASVGPVVQAVGLANAFSVSVAMSLLAAGLAYSLDLPSRSDQQAGPSPLAWRDVLQGLSYVWHDPVVRVVFALDALYFIMGDGVLMAGLPLFVRDVLHAGPEVYGYLRAAGNAGMLLGAFLLGRFGRRANAQRLILLCWLGYGLSLVGYSLSPGLAPALVASFVSLMIGHLIPTLSTSLLQRRASQEIVGRVFGVWSMIAPGAGSFSGILGAELARFLPPRAMIAFGAAVSVGNALLGVVGGLGHRLTEVRERGQVGDC
jgi:MFS family permease